MNLDDLITQSDAARLRDVSPARINRLIKEERLEVFVVAGKPLLSRTAVLALEVGPVGVHRTVKTTKAGPTKKKVVRKAKLPKRVGKSKPAPSAAGG